MQYRLSTNSSNESGSNSLNYPSRLVFNNSMLNINMVHNNNLSSFGSNMGINNNLRLDNAQSMQRMFYNTEKNLSRSYISPINHNIYQGYVSMMNPLNINAQFQKEQNQPQPSGNNNGTGQKKKSNLFNNLENKEVNLEEIAKGKDKLTTIMIRNIPIKYTDDMLLEELDDFKNKFDCLYLPYDFEQNGNRGYAFINFTHPLHILMFHFKFSQKTWNHCDSKKICRLNYANFQGIDEIKIHANKYKGKKPSFFDIKEVNTNIEIPNKYLKMVLEGYPNINYTEDKINKTITIKNLPKAVCKPINKKIKNYC